MSEDVFHWNYQRTGPVCPSWLWKLSSIKYNVSFLSLLGKPPNYYLIVFNIFCRNYIIFQDSQFASFFHPNKYMVRWQISKQLQYDNRKESCRETTWRHVLTQHSLGVPRGLPHRGITSTWKTSMSQQNQKEESGLTRGGILDKGKLWYSGLDLTNLAS